jgi:hypothetical protein
VLAEGVALCVGGLLNKGSQINRSGWVMCRKPSDGDVVSVLVLSVAAFPAFDRGRLSRVLSMRGYGEGSDRSVVRGYVGSLVALMLRDDKE